MKPPPSLNISRNLPSALAVTFVSASALLGCLSLRGGPSTTLMLEVLPDVAASGMVKLNLHGTVSNQFYHIQSATGISAPVQWREEASLLGLDAATPVNPIAKLNRATLFLRARTADWGIISQPLSQDLSAGDTVTLSVVAGGVGPFDYQWSLNGTVIPGATNSTYTITNLQSTTAGAYAATVTRGSELLQSGPAQLTVEPWSWSVAQAESVSANDDFPVHAWNGSGYTTKQVTFSNLVAAVNTRNGWVTPYDFGAAGDGITDDTVALQQWLNVAEASNYVAYLAPARGNYYMITDTLWATNSQGLRLIGAGGQDHISSPRTTKAH